MNYSKVILKKIWIIFLIPFLFFSVSAYVYCFRATPLYEANAKLIVINSSENKSNGPVAYNDLLAEQLLVKNYKELIKSRSITSEVKKQLNLKNITEDELGDSIDVSLITDSNMLMITVSNKDPNDAKKIADEVSEVFISKASELMKTKNISIVDNAVVSLEPTHPKKFQNISIATFLGLVISFLIIILIAFFDDTIGTSQEIERKFNIPVIGIIPEKNIN